MPLTTELHRAVEQGDTEKISRLLAEGVDANATDLYGRTALLLAVQLDRLDLVKLLFPRSEANKPDTKGLTPLGCAIVEKKLKIARFLLKHGVNPNESYEDGWTALHVAVTVGHDSTPVEFSSTIGDVALARCLLEHGADSTAINADGEMPLHYAMQVGNIEMAELLIPRMGDKCDKGDRSGNTPLNLAVQQGHQQVALFLLDHGANPLAVGPRGRTPLHEAARQGNLDLLKRLSNAVPPLTLVQPDADGNTPLHLAVCNYSVKDRSWESDNIAVVEWLLSVARADPNIPDEIGYTPLHEAASQGLAKIMKILLRNGADPKRRDREGRVPLHVSAEHGDVETAKILFEGTGGLNLRDKEGMTPLLLSVYSRHSRILKMVKELLLLSADPTETDIQGNTPLHLTVPFSGADMRADCDEQKKGFIAVDIAELLLKNGAEIDARNKEGMTSLQVAMQMGMGMGMGMGMKIDYYSVRNNALIACFLQHGESIGRDFARPGFTGLLTLCPTVLENAVVIGAKFPVDYRPPASAITTPAEFFARVWTAQQYLTFVVMTDKACQADPANTVLAEFHRALLMKMQTHSLKLAASMVVGNRREVRTLVAGEMSYFYSTGKMRESKHCCPKELYPLLFAHPKMRAEVERAKAARAPVVEMEDEAAGGGGGAGRTRGDDVRDAAVAGDEVRAPRAASDAAGKEAEIEEDDEIQVGEPALTPPQSPSGEPGSHQLREKHLLRNIAILLEFSDPRSVGVEEIIDAFIKLAPNTRRMMLFTKADKDSDALGKLKIVLNLDDDSTPDNIFEAARRFIERSRSAAAGSDVESGDASLAQGALSDGGGGAAPATPPRGVARSDELTRFTAAMSQASRCAFTLKKGTHKEYGEKMALCDWQTVTRKFIADQLGTPVERGAECDATIARCLKLLKPGDDTNFMPWLLEVYKEWQQTELNKLNSCRVVGGLALPNTEEYLPKLGKNHFALWAAQVRVYLAVGVSVHLLEQYPRNSRLNKEVMSLLVANIVDWCATLTSLMGLQVDVDQIKARITAPHAFLRGTADALCNHNPYGIAMHLRNYIKEISFGTVYSEYKTVLEGLFAADPTERPAPAAPCSVARSR